MSKPVSDAKLMRRVLRRESHSSRAALSTVAAVTVTVIAVYFLLESALRALGQPPWLADPLTAAQRVADLPEGIEPGLLAALGALLALLGLVFFFTAVLPGKRSRHVIADDRIAVVADDEVIASALARCARLAAGVTREQVLVVLSRRAVTVNIRPTSGVPVDESAVHAAVQEEAGRMALEPRPQVRINVAAVGVVGV
ncbi:DUF6286 domain-containing protein [Arthrobacter terrae]|nr:DUF6286 domain-containing protein [Arthrobacter terrae]